MAKKKKVKDFAKVKLKVGKKLKKTAQTDTTISAKKVVLLEQLVREGHQGEAVSHRGLSLDELCRQLGHYNVNIRKDAVVGVRQLLSSHPHLIPSHLHTLIPAIARLICDENADGAFRSQLRALLELLCQTPSLVMSSHFELFLAHILLALTHLKIFVRIFAISILVLLMRTYPDLCRTRRDLFNSLSGVLASQKKPTNRQLLIDAVNSLLNVFAVEEVKKSGPLYTAVFSVDFMQVSAMDLTSQHPNFHFSVLGPNTAQEVSPLKTHEGILRLSSAVFPILETLLSEEKNVFDDHCIEIVTKLAQTISSIRELGQDEDFERKLIPIVNPFMLLIARRRSSRMLKKAAEPLLRTGS